MLSTSSVGARPEVRHTCICGHELTGISRQEALSSPCIGDFLFPPKEGCLRGTGVGLKGELLLNI